MRPTARLLPIHSFRGEIQKFRVRCSVVTDSVTGIEIGFERLRLEPLSPPWFEVI